MNKDLNKYRYLGAVNPVTPFPETWIPDILNMLVEIDKIVKPKYTPRFALNLMNDMSCTIEGQVTNVPVYSKLKSKISNVSITQIRQKFAALKISGTFTNEIQAIVTATETACNNTCEFCGSPNTTHVMVKSWVRNLCTTCKEVKKYGTNN